MRDAFIITWQSGWVGWLGLAFMAVAIGMAIYYFIYHVILHPRGDKKK